MAHCVAAVYYTDSSFVGEYADGLELSLVVANIGAVLIGVVVYLVTMAEDKFQKSTVAALASAIAKLIVTLQLEMRPQAQSLVDALEQAAIRVPPLDAGCRVTHPVHGRGVIAAFVPDDVREKPYHVTFDSGETHHYSVESARKKLLAYKERGDAPADTALLDEFQHGVQHCLQGCHISPAALEALFLTLKFLDAEQNLEAYTTRAWVSMSLVPVSSHVPLPSVPVRRSPFV
jgi:hypothetical protein